MVLMMICTLLYSFFCQNRLFINCSFLLKAYSVGRSSSNRLCGFLWALPCPRDLTLIRLAGTNYYHPLSGKGSSLDVWRPALDSSFSRTCACSSCGWEGALMDTGERTGLPEGETVLERDEWWILCQSMRKMELAVRKIHAELWWWQKCWNGQYKYYRKWYLESHWQLN